MTKKTCYLVLATSLLLAGCESSDGAREEGNPMGGETAKPDPAGGENAKKSETPGTSTAGEAARKPEPPAAPAKEPDTITVQHILIGFKGSVGAKPLKRSREEAKQLAEELLDQALAGADFDALVKEHTDDSHPGIYKMANTDVPPAPGVYAREKMVAAFGDVGFPLKVGGIGMAPHDPGTSRFGWHIIKRLE